MRFSVFALVASIAAVANAQSDAYPFKPNGACVASCLLTVGKKMYPDFTDDPTNNNFLTSLSYAHDRGTPKYMSYMSDTGPCIGKCPLEEQNLYKEQYDAKNTWYLSHKDGANTTASGAPASSGLASGFVGTVALLSAAALF
ncbi:hypothetical protein BGZ65_012688 [Modicella reniformis]|uniref:Secreted protein n=1 Tax=Modicella reniformis TaxID=1440133 RepID=A0A9P6J3D5_9FUNG|nr:hypothetical protein BGZ65_012688 [Modicella reniformis]